MGGGHIISDRNPGDCHNIYCNLFSGDHKPLGGYLKMGFIKWATYLTLWIIVPPIVTPLLVASFVRFLYTNWRDSK